MTLQARTRAGFVETFGVEPEGIAFAPGRVNLIGEHVDYNDGLVLPMPISTGTAVAWRRSTQAGIDAVALDFGAARDCFVPGEPEPHQPPDWRSYLRGMAQGLVQRGVATPGLQIAIAGSNPRGAGLSSSASLCIAIGRAISQAAATELHPRELALAAQSAEHDWAGVKCGIMDQMAIAAGQPGHALLLDCRDLVVEQVPLPQGWAVVIIQSGVTRGLVEGHYNARRLDCEAAAAALGVPSLREASRDLIEVADLEPVIRARAQHVIEEIARTRAAVAAIASQDITAFGQQLRASHVSLRDLFEVSVPAVDALVDLANAAIGPRGGARMTGGGFGGAIVAVLEAAALPAFVDRLEREFAVPRSTTLNLMIEGAGGDSAGLQS